MLTASSIVKLSPAPGRREWMERTPERFANRCLPLLMANQAGWFVELTEPVEVEWNGRDGLGDVEVTGSELVRENVASHFGCGIVTFKLPYLFEVEEGYNLLARGPANVFKDGIAPLEGLVEADWSVAPFTMNWKLTRPRQRVRFEAEEPICQLVPQRRRELSEFDPVLVDLDADARVSRQYREWRESRDTFIGDLAAGREEVVRAGWQRDYFLGRAPGGAQAPEHETKLSLRPFRRGDGPGESGERS